MFRRRVILATRERTLPIKYQQVQFIESNNQHYIDTMYNINTNTRIECKCCATGISNQYGAVFGTAENNSSNPAFLLNAPTNANPDGINTVIWVRPGYYSTSNQTNIKSGIAWGLNTIHQISVKINELIVDGNLFTSTIFSFQNISRTLKLFARGGYNSAVMQNNGGYAYAKCRIYDLIISENDNIIKHFIPCYRKSDNKPGMYDIVNGEFYTNANTSATQDFAVGADVG